MPSLAHFGLGSYDEALAESDLAPVAAPQPFLDAIFAHYVSGGVGGVFVWDERGNARANIIFPIRTQGFAFVDNFSKLVICPAHGQTPGDILYYNIVSTETTFSITYGGVFLAGSFSGQVVPSGGIASGEFIIAGVSSSPDPSLYGTLAAGVGSAYYDGATIHTNDVTVLYDMNRTNSPSYYADLPYYEAPIAFVRGSVAYYGFGDQYNFSFSENDTLPSFYQKDVLSSPTPDIWTRTYINPAPPPAAAPDPRVVKRFLGRSNVFNNGQAYIQLRDDDLEIGVPEPLYAFGGGSPGANVGSTPNGESLHYAQSYLHTGRSYALDPLSNFPVSTVWQSYVPPGGYTTVPVSTGGGFDGVGFRCYKVRDPSFVPPESPPDDAPGLEFDEFAGQDPPRWGPPFPP